MEPKLVRKLSDNTMIGELAGLDGYGFNAVRRNVRFAPAPPFSVPSERPS